MNARAEWSPGVCALAVVLVVSLGALPRAGWAAEAVGDSYSTPYTTPLTVAAPGILANDDCESCVVASVDGTFFEGQITFGEAPDGQDPLPPLASGSGATLTVHGDGSFTYDPTTAPDPSLLTSDSFSYQCDDSRGISSTVTVSITLTAPPASSPPVANDDSYSVELGAVLSVSAPGVLGNDTDADGDPLTVATVNGAAPSFGSPIPLAHGELTIQADGSFTYTPDAGASAGVDESFQYTAFDGSESSNAATVAISLVQSTTGDTTVRVTFDDVGFVTVDSEIGLSGVEGLEVAAAFGSTAQVSGGGLPPTTGALILRHSDGATEGDARNLFAGCERMALLAQAQPTKYDLVLEISTATPASSFSTGGDGEVIVETSATRVKCWTTRPAT